MKINKSYSYPEGMLFFPFCPLPAIALAQARQAGLIRKEKITCALCGSNERSEWAVSQTRA